MSSDRVRTTVEQHVATVTMTRGEKHNALDAGMFAGLRDAGARLREEPGVRAVVLHGEGPSFCSGLDVGSFVTGPVSVGELMGRPDGEIANLAQRAALAWAELPVPVIAAIHGSCLGGGLQVALGADLRIAAPDAILSVMEITWGLVPDMGITQTLPRLLGIDRAKELTFTGRRVSGTEAAALGLVTSVAAEPLAAARALAAELATRSPDALRAAKRLYDATWAGALAPAEALALETELQLALLGSPNQVAAVTAALTREPARYVDPAPAPA